MATKTKPVSKRVTINPVYFTQSQWEEMASCGIGCELLKTDRYSGAKTVRPTMAQVRELAVDLRMKAGRIKAGLLGIEGDERQWAGCLLDCAVKLEDITRDAAYSKKRGRNG